MARATAGAGSSSRCEAQAVAHQRRFVLGRVARPPVQMPHHEGSRVPELGVIVVERRAQRAADIARERLKERLLEDARRGDRLVHQDVLHDAAGHGQVLGAGETPGEPRHPDAEALGRALRARREIVMPRFERRPGFSRRTDFLQQPIAPDPAHALMLKREVVEIERERPGLVVETIEAVFDEVDVRRLAVGRHAHDLVFVVVLEAHELGEERIHACPSRAAADARAGSRCGCRGRAQSFASCRRPRRPS